MKLTEKKDQNVPSSLCYVDSGNNEGKNHYYLVIT